MPVPPARTTRSGWTSLLPVVLAACCVVTAGDRPGAAAPPSRSRAGRFLDGIIKKVEPTPAFIPLPQPPSQEEVDRVAAKKPKRSAPATRPTPVVASPGADEARPPSWNDAVAIGSQLKEAASKVVDDATNPDYKPKPKPVRNKPRRPRKTHSCRCSKPSCNSSLKKLILKKSR
jgi:hypothetical protein